MVETARVANVTHPLDPLSRDELETVIAAARKELKLSQHHLIATVQLEEPTKSALADYQTGKTNLRAARLTIFDRTTAKVSETVITISGKVLTHQIIEGAKAPHVSIESVQAIAAAKKDQRVIEALLQRGISDLSTVIMETWPIGAHIP